jgi:signal transduction histidine kinase
MRLPIPAANDELRELSLTFNEMLDRLEEAVQRLRRFTGDVSHELRTPLAVLRGEAELALRRERTPEQYKESLQSIKSEACHMTTIIEDLLLLARAESKSLAINWVNINPHDFAYQVNSYAASSLEKKKVRLKCTVLNSVPDFSASSNLLALAVNNLLTNAIKHSEEGGEVLLNISDEPGHILFEVVDRGEGISLEAQPYVFDSFYRADTARNRAAGGVGIGLSLTKALVKLHGGEVSVHSVAGQGAKFSIKLPLNLDQKKNRVRVKSHSSEAIKARREALAQR